MLHCHWVVEKSSMEGCLLGRIQPLQWVCKSRAEGQCKGRISPYMHYSTLHWASTARCILCWLDFCFDVLWLSLCSAVIHEKHDCRWGSVVPKQFLEWQTCQQFLEQNFLQKLFEFHSVLEENESPGQSVRSLNHSALGWGEPSRAYCKKH